MENTWINPLSHDETELVNLSTGILALPDVASDLLKAHQVGEEAFQTLRKDCLEKEPPKVKFHEKTKPKDFQ